MNFTSIQKEAGYDWCSYILGVEQIDGITLTFSEEKPVTVDGEDLVMKPLSDDGIIYGYTLRDKDNLMVATLFVDPSRENSLRLMYPEGYSEYDPHSDTYSPKVNHEEVLGILENHLFGREHGYKKLLT